VNDYGHALNPAGPEKPGRHSLITGPGRLQLSAQSSCLKYGPVRTVRRLWIEFTTVGTPRTPNRHSYSL